MLGVAAFAQMGPTHADPKAGLLTFLGTCFAGGFASLFTPCVFPIIPVTVSFFSKRKEGAVAGAIAYAIGMVGSFALMGLLSSLVFGATGVANFAAGPAFNLVLAALFIVLAFNLFGVYEITLPLWLTNRLGSASRKEGLAGPLLMGAAFSITTFTCTAPIVASLLANGAKGQWFYPTIGMTAYGVAFATPFFALAISPSSLSRTPKAGAWIASVKPVMGFIELAAAVKFLSNADLTLGAGLLQRQSVLYIWIGIFGGLTYYLARGVRQGEKIGYGRLSATAISAFVVAFLASGLGGRDLGSLDAYLPQDPYPYIKHAPSVAASKPVTPAAPVEVPTGPILAEDYQDALAKAKASGRPIFIDFTGVNCTNCRWMEKNIFPKADVQSEFGRFVKVQLFTDRPNPSDQANQKLQTELVGSNGLPTYALVSADGKVLSKLEGAEQDAGKFAAFLRSATKS